MYVEGSQRTQRGVQDHICPFAWPYEAFMNDMVQN